MDTSFINQLCFINEEGSVRERCTSFRINIHMNKCQNDDNVNDDVIKKSPGPKKDKILNVNLKMKL